MIASSSRPADGQRKGGPPTGGGQNRAGGRNGSGAGLGVGDVPCQMQTSCFHLHRKTLVDREMRYR